MSLPFITQRERVTITTYHRVFDRTDIPGAGFVFDCDASGDIKPLAPAGFLNYGRCLEGVRDGSIIDRGVVANQHSYTNPASVRCDCGDVLWLEDPLYTQCERCGLGVNGSGQRLAPVSSWEREDQYAVFGPRNVPED